METALKTDVLIVGAGPTGLSLACQFVRFGVDFVIIDKKETITPYSKAIGVQARTLEIYDQIGLADTAVEQGTIAEKARLIIGGEVRGVLDFANIGEGLSPFPFVLMLEQSKNEKLLYEYLQSHQKEVRWKTELETFSQDKDGVTAQVKLSDGSARTVEAKYIVGCDGPKSPVRHTAGLTFEGSTFERIFFVADAQVDWDLSHDALSVCFSEDSFVVFFPLKGEKRYRIVGVFPEEFNKDEGEILYEEIEARIKKEANLKLDIHDVEWFSTYKVHTRHVNNFSAGRCFLAGDAAHVHSPAGAQGMNTGIQDAYNLAWKLVFVLRGGGEEKLLDSYNEERLENAKHLLKTTDRMFQFVASPEWFLEFLRMNVLPYFAKYIMRFSAVKEFVFPLVSQTGISYRNSSISDHSGDKNFEIEAGDRMPYFQVNGESIYDKLNEPKFHFMVFTDTKTDVALLKAEIKNSYSDLIDFNAVPINPRITEIFGTDKPFCVLLRPDNHIGYISLDISADKIEAYLRLLKKA